MVPQHLRLFLILLSSNVDIILLSKFIMLIITFIGIVYFIFHFKSLSLKSFFNLINFVSTLHIYNSHNQLTAAIDSRLHIGVGSNIKAGVQREIFT